MDYKDQLKLQSYLDDELPDQDRRQVENWLARDPQAAALSAELGHTRQALAGFEEEIRLPESRDFYWSKIQREIQHRQTPAPGPAPAPWLYKLRRLLVPAAGLAVIALLTLTVTIDSGRRRTPESSAETALEDSGAFTYHDYSAGATLVWLSYPADNELGEDEDLNSLD